MSAMDVLSKPFLAKHALAADKIAACVLDESSDWGSAGRFIL